MRAALAALLICGLTACSSAEPTKSVVLTDYGFSLQLPQSWTVQQHEAGLRLLARPVARDGKPVPAAYFSVSRDESRLTGSGRGTVPTLTGYADFKQQQVRRLAYRYELLSRTPLSLDAVPALRDERRIATRKQAYRATAVLVVREGIGYSLIGAADEADAAGFRPRFERIVGSLRWLS